MRDRGEEEVQEIIIVKVYSGSVTLSPDEPGIMMEGETPEGRPVLLKLLAEPEELAVEIAEVARSERGQ